MLLLAELVVLATLCAAIGFVGAGWIFGVGARRKSRALESELLRTQRRLREQGRLRSLGERSTERLIRHEKRARRQAAT